VVDGVLDKLFAAIVVGALVMQGHLSWLPALLLATRELGELPLVAWWATHDGQRRARAEDRRANWLGKAATVVQFIAIAAVLFHGRTRYGWLALSAATGIAAAILYWRRELRAAAPGAGHSRQDPSPHMGTSLALIGSTARPRQARFRRDGREAAQRSCPNHQERGLLMETFKRGYALKAAGMLLFMAGIAAVLFFGPMLHKPEPVVPVDLPAMSNIPPEGSLHIETE
jgi:hypothetical protein